MWAGDYAHPLLGYLCLLFCSYNHLRLHFSCLCLMYLALLGSWYPLSYSQHALLCCRNPLQWFPSLMLYLYYWWICNFISRPGLLFLKWLPFPVSFIHNYYPLSLVCNSLEDFRYSWRNLLGLCSLLHHLHRLWLLLHYWLRLHRIRCYYCNYYSCYPLLRRRHMYWNNSCILLKWSHFCQWR